MTTINCDGMTIEGKSIGGLATYLRVKELNLLFDLGRCPIDFIGTDHVFISHFHLDHYFGLPIYISQRYLSKLPAGEIYVPSNGASQLKAILDQISLLDSRHIWDYKLIPVNIGDRFLFRKNLSAYVLPAEHGVPAVGYLICERRKKLKSEFHGRPGKELAKLRRSGVELSSEIELPLIAYFGDTRTIPFDVHPLIEKCKVLICESTFVAPEDRKHAADKNHMHISFLPQLLDRFPEGKIILTHFSRRYSTEYVRRQADKILSNSAHRERVHLLV